ncbi:hypothetical protein [Nocardia nova]|nr:hypothetical protein [Nocardia nova]
MRYACNSCAFLPYLEFGPAQWTPAFFGMLADRFGVTWIVGVVAEYTQA